MRRRIGVILSFSFLCLSGCGLSPFVEPKANPVIEDGIGSLRTVATTGERRLAYVRKEPLHVEPADKRTLNKARAQIFQKSSYGNRRGKSNTEDPNVIQLGRFGGNVGEYCAEPSPDAIESVAAAFGASFSAESKNPSDREKAAKLQFARTVATNAASVFRRSQGVQLYRDGAFFLCQAMMNGYMDAYEYRVALRFLRGDAKDLIEAEFKTNAWKADPTFVSVGAVSAPLPEGLFEKSSTTTTTTKQTNIASSK